MRTYDFSRDRRSPWGAVAVDYIAHDDQGIQDVHVGSLEVRIPCELCGALPTTHYARMVVLDARDNQPTVSIFRICCDCWADARREGTLIVSTEV